MRGGETLFSIAWGYGIDYKKIANLNNIKAPFRIFPDQALALDKSSIKLSKSSTKVTKNPKKNRYIADRYKKANTHNKEIHQKDGHALGKGVNIDWTWPVVGKVIEKFSVKGIGNKGLDFSGNHGDRVNAAAKGNVVYSGSGLRGYGKLIIIKHNDVFLSAYAHNSRIVVKEGDVVKAGEKIAEIGSSDTDKEKLHFEIRYRGKPVDPIRYLPRR
ncbi:MAG: peptidoglycan DD-metalloendopeptidase family protein [Pseudomonadales bacterium]|nr:peptidoglycan DD-metalloendopeptidase family protein [Pseudomonadales bacterium]